MKKIGIITFHFVENYGALFQVHALQMVLEHFGYDPQIINYLPEHQRKLGSIKYKQRSLKNLVSFCVTSTWNIINRKDHLSSEAYFMNYRLNHLHVSDKKYLTNHELMIQPPDYDFYIAGSDQIWNPQITGGKLDSAYFLEFAHNPDKCISYAASLGTAAINSIYNIEFSNLIKNIGKISVREVSAVPFVERASEKKVACSLDPTLLIDKKTWDIISQKPTASADKYILIFMLSHDTSLLSLGKRISEILKIPIIQIGMAYSHHIPHLSRPRPEEWLWYFANAEIIVTNSFHGTVFSIINEKPFYSIISNPKKVRIIDLLTSVELMSRFSEHGESITNIDLNIDYETVREKLKELREPSLNYLKYALNIKDMM